MQNGVNYLLLLCLPGMAVLLVASYWLAFRHRRMIGELKAQVQDYEGLRVEHYLQREAQITRRHLRQRESDSDNVLDQMRLIWLEAELLGLVDQGRRYSSYAALIRAAQPLILLMKNAAKTLPVMAPTMTLEKSNPAAQIQKARAALALQVESVKQLRHAVFIPDPTGAAPKNKAVVKTLDHVEHNAADLMATIIRLEAELKSLSKKYEAAVTKLQAAPQDQRAQLSKNPQSSDLFIISTAVNADPTGNSAQALLQETAQAYEQSIAEMERMRAINRKQRTLILQLESEMQLLRKDSAHYESSSVILDQLKLQLRDYETCTATLESEADALRERIDELTRLLATEGEGGQPVPQANVVSHASAVAGHKPNSSFDGFALLVDVAKLNAADKIVARVIEWLAERKMSAVIFLRGHQAHLWASSEGNIDAHSKQLLQSINAPANDPLVAIKEGVLFANPIFRVLIYQGPSLQAHMGDLQHLFPLLDRWMALLEADKLMQHEITRREQLHIKLTEILGQYNYVVKEHQRMTGKLHTEFEDFLATSTLSDIQRECAVNMLADYLSEQEILGKASKLVYNRLKTALHHVEERALPS